MEISEFFIILFIFSAVLCFVVLIHNDEPLSVNDFCMTLGYPNAGLSRIESKVINNSNYVRCCKDSLNSEMSSFIKECKIFKMVGKK